MSEKYKGHTPPPWKISKVREPYTVVLMPESKTSETDITPYASIGGFTARKKHEMQANAILIADAPMLADQNARALPILKALNLLYKDSKVYRKESELTTEINNLISEIEAS